MSRHLKPIPYPELWPPHVSLPRAGEALRPGWRVRIERKRDAFTVWQVPDGSLRGEGLCLDDAQVGEPVRVVTRVVGIALNDPRDEDDPTLIRLTPEKWEQEYIFVVVEEPSE